MKIIVFIGCMMMSSFAFSQSLEEYQWKNRLVLLFSKNAEEPLVKQQLKLFEKEMTALKDRKLKILHLIPGKHREVLPEKSQWTHSELFRRKSTDSDFEIMLVGLDGGTKLSESKIVQPDDLFRLIDSMPMRQAEMRRKND